MKAIKTVRRYTKDRFNCMRHGWGRPRFRPLWLEAIVYAVVRTRRLQSRAFNRWCDEVDALFVAQFNWRRPYTLDGGRDCFIDSYANGMTPQQAVDSEVQHWEV